MALCRLKRLPQRVNQLSSLFQFPRVHLAGLTLLPDVRRCSEVIRKTTWSLCAPVTKYCFSMKSDSIFLNAVSAVVCTGTSVCPSLVNRHVLAIKCHFIRKGNANILSVKWSWLQFLPCAVLGTAFRVNTSERPHAMLFRWPSVTNALKCFIHNC